MSVDREERKTIRSLLKVGNVLHLTPCSPGETGIVSLNQGCWQRMMIGQVLTSWKEIAAYLGKGVRTVQRWEAEMDLPVRRPGADRHIVLAFPAELDEWARKKHKRRIHSGNEIELESAYPTIINVRKQRDASTELKRLRTLMSTMMLKLSHNREQTIRLVKICEQYRGKNGRQKMLA